MANQYFQFKQFLIEQENCAMKVGTDSVLLAALTAANNIKNALDIGTGTGILTLMLAQKNSTLEFDAIEIDELAFLQASNNFSKSKFSTQIKPHLVALQQFVANKQYDLIITNPPYFISKSNYSIADLQRAKARHDNDLTFEELIDCVKKMMNTNGVFKLILPVHEAIIFRKLALQKGLFCSESILIKPKTSKPSNRVIMSFITQNITETESEFIIYNEDNTQTEAYKNLTSDYYL
ncbi:MAG: methyltransferase [Bacteroidia bacterium]|nr:methyltransferase [Bacteroidia bacterium]